MIKKALITGIAGQDGPYLAKLLLEKRYKVFGLIQDKSPANFANTDFLGVTDRIRFVVGDMRDEKSLTRVVKNTRPDEIYNLAAQSFVASSWEKPKLATEVNSLGVLYLLEAIRKYSPKTKFYQASTSEIFGGTHLNGVQVEETPFYPKSPYAVTKLYAYFMANVYRQSHQLFCCNGILYNHESPIRAEHFVTRKISLGVARIKLALQKNIRLGNLDSRRDWGFAGDYVEAMWLMMQKNKPDDYIISTGETHSIKDFLKVAFSCVGITSWQKYIKIDPAFKRPSELMVLEGRSDKARKVLGWKPKVGFEKLVKMMVDADLERERNKISRSRTSNSS